MRMDLSRYTQKIFEMRAEGRRERGRSQVQWEDNIKELASKRGKHLRNETSSQRQE